MKTLKLDNNDDWTLKIIDEPLSTLQSIKTRLRSFVGDCFFDVDFGLDVRFFDKGTQDALRNNILQILSDTINVDKVDELSIENVSNRMLQIKYKISILQEDVEDTTDLNINI